MTNNFHAVAIDYDGTLATGPQPTAEALAVAAVQDIESAMREASADERARLRARLGATVREQLAATV